MSIALDLNALEAAPRPDLSELVTVRLRLLEPDGQGLASAAETERLKVIERKLAAQAGGARAFVFVGRRVCDGSAEYFFYAHRGTTAQLRLEFELEPFSEYERSIEVIGDADWKVYREELYPSPRDRRLLLDRKAVAALAAQGDDPARARTLRHLARFETEETGANFASIATERGYRCQLHHNQDEAVAGAFVVEVEHESTLLEEALRVHTLRLLELATQHGGEYAGWEAPVQR